MMASMIERAAAGHGKSMTALYEEHRGRVYAYCCALVDKDVAKEIAVAVLTEGYAAAAESGIADEQFGTFLAAQAAKKLAKHALSGDAPQADNVTPKAKFVRANAVYSGDVAEGLKAFGAMVEKLTPYQRFAYVSAMAGGLSAEAIGAAMGQREAIARFCLETAAYQVARMPIGAVRVDQMTSLFAKAAEETEFPQTADAACRKFIAEHTKRQTPLWKILVPVAAALAVVAAIVLILLPKKEPVYYADIDIADYGTITVKLDQSAAPITVENFVKLAESGYYDGLTFHRIMDGFMMQGGDGGDARPAETIEGEFESNGHKNPIKHERGVISMARTNDPNSANSQFFIMHEAAEHLDGEYAAFGHVVKGIEIVDKVCTTVQPTDDNGTIPADEQPIINSIKIRKE